jgi:transcriptional regulator with XRE-family HTH domain
MTFGQDPTTPRTANDWLRVNVQELMKVRRWTQAQLADRLGVSQPWLSKRLTGTTPFQIEDLDSISALFGLTPQELLCAGYGKWDRRSGRERRSGFDRRGKARSTPAEQPSPPFRRREHPHKDSDGGGGSEGDGTIQ